MAVWYASGDASRRNTMATLVTEKQIPAFEGDTSFEAARRWYGAMYGVAGPIHADDGYEAVSTSARGEETLLDPDALAAARRAHAAFRAGSSDWADPDILYDLAGNGPFQVEKDHPGFVVDRSIGAASRTGWQSLPNQDVPTLVVEEGGNFVAIRVIAFDGPMSEAPIFEVVPVDGGSFGADGGIDVAGMLTRRGEGESVESFDEVEGAIERVALGAVPRP
jgi:hypothetical protein